MSAKKRFGLILMVLGALLLIAALLLFLHNDGENTRAEEVQTAAMNVLHDAVTTLPPAPSQEAENPGLSTETTVPTAVTEAIFSKELKTKIINGHEYIGYLHFPSLNRELPVMKLVYVEDLQLSPCIQSGSPYTNDAVISGHNYPAQLGPLRDFTGGEQVIFTDLDGNTITYTVEEVTTLEPSETDAILHSDYHMVIYTCTTGGNKRVLLGLNRE